MNAAEARLAFEGAADEAEIRIGVHRAKNPIAMFMVKHHNPTIGARVPRPRKR